jgi:Domain of unknown function (DUF927)
MTDPLDFSHGSTRARTREAAKGYDAVDALADWQDVDALGEVAASLAEPFDPGPAYVSFRPYAMDASGLAIEIERGRGETKRTESLWIAGPFEVLGASRDPHGDGWGKILRWRDDDGRAHVRHDRRARHRKQNGPLGAFRLVNGGAAPTGSKRQADARSAHRTRTPLFPRASLRSAFT